MMKKVCISLVILLSLSSCSTQQVNTNINKESLSVSFKTNIKGIAQFPKVKFGIKADITDVSKDATVSILYPSDHPVNANKIISSGLTDANGLFDIGTDAGFIPDTNQTYVLEASKRLGGVGNNVLTIRTLIKWNGNSWDSITTNKILINNFTTALSVILSYNKTTLSASQLIGTVNTSSGSNVPSDIGTITAQTVTDVADLVTTALTGNKDPFFNIRFINGSYTLSTAPTTDIIEEFITSSSCTGCDLRSMDLTNISLKGKDLSNANLSGINLTDKDLSGANLTDANLSGCNMSNTDLSNTTLTGANLSDAYLVNSKITSRNLSGTNFTYAFLNGADLSGSTLNTPNQTIFTNADLSNAKWIDNSVSSPHICANNSYGQCN